MGKIDKLQFVDFTHTMRYVMEQKRLQSAPIVYNK